MSTGDFGCLALDFVDVSITEFPVRAEWGSHEAEPAGEFIARLFLGSLPLL